MVLTSRLRDCALIPRPVACPRRITVPGNLSTHPHTQFGREPRRHISRASAISASRTRLNVSQSTMNGPPGVQYPV